VRCGRPTRSKGVPFEGGQTGDDEDGGKGGRERGCPRSDDEGTDLYSGSGETNDSVGKKMEV
jgi:hypothetical protein